MKKLGIFLCMIFLCSVSFAGCGKAEWNPPVEREMEVQQSITQSGIYHIEITNFKEPDVSLDANLTADNSNLSLSDLSLDEELSENSDSIIANVGYFCIDQENVFPVSKAAAYNSIANVDQSINDIQNDPFSDPIASDSDEAKKKGNPTGRSYFKTTQIVYKNRKLFPSDTYVCFGAMEWIQDPSYKGMDCLAFLWTDGAHRDNTYKNYEKGELNALRFQSNTYTPYESPATKGYEGNHIEYYMNLKAPSGCKLSKYSAKGMVVLNAKQDFDFYMYYAHRKNGLNYSISITTGGFGLSFAPTIVYDQFNAPSLFVEVSL